MPIQKDKLINRKINIYYYHNVFENIINNYKEVTPQKNDTDYFDAFDHTITKLLNKEELDKYFGIQSPVVIPQGTQLIQAFYPK